MANLLPLNPDELLTTTRAVGKRLDLTRPVERAAVEECIEIAMQAPSGSNRKEWQFVLVHSPSLERAQRRIAADQHTAFFGRILTMQAGPLGTRPCLLVPERTADVGMHSESEELEVFHVMRRAVQTKLRNLLVDLGRRRCERIESGLDRFGHGSRSKRLRSTMVWQARRILSPIHNLPRSLDGSSVPAITTVNSKQCNTAMR